MRDRTACRRSGGSRPNFRSRPLETAPDWRALARNWRATKAEEGAGAHFGTAQAGSPRVPPGQVGTTEWHAAHDPVILDLSRLICRARSITRWRGTARSRGRAYCRSRAVGDKDNSVVSREIVESHDGRIGFSSQPGVGSLFWFELPAV